MGACIESLHGVPSPPASASIDAQCHLPRLESAGAGVFPKIRGTKYRGLGGLYEHIYIYIICI